MAILDRSLEFTALKMANVTLSCQNKILKLLIASNTNIPVNVQVQKQIEKLKSAKLTRKLPSEKMR